MIARISGRVVEQTDKGLIVDVGGVGYLIFTPALAPLGEMVTLHTHMVVRDDCQELYGFALPEEKMLFSILIGVSGVGPKTALQMLTLYPLPELVRCVRAGDAKAIALTPGIGKKTAEKIVIDLKDKLEGFTTAESTGPKADLVEALISLGYKEMHIRAVVAEIDGTVPIEKQITTALQLLQK